MAPSTLLELAIERTKRAGLGQLHALGGAHKQLHAQLFFQLLNLPGERRLRDMQPRRGAADVQLFRHGDEVFQMPEIHVFSPARARWPQRQNPYLKSIEFAIVWYWTVYQRRP